MYQEENLLSNTHFDHDDKRDRTLLFLHRILILLLYYNYYYILIMLKYERLIKKVFRYVNVKLKTVLNPKRESLTVPRR